jgi:xylan 1,4-beta-xylosidase
MDHEPSWVGISLPQSRGEQAGAVGGGGGRGADPVAQAKSEMEGDPLSLTLKLAGVGETSRVRITSIDMLRGSALPAWQALGSPQYPTAAEIQKLRDAAVMPAAEERVVRNGELTIESAPSGVALVEVEK